MPGTGTMLTYWLACIALGGVPFALLLGWSRGVDIRSVGSGNVGATNLGRALGVPWGVAAFLFDALKGALPVIVWNRWLVDETGSFWPAVVGGVLAVLAHCYSPYLRFKGGKGVATAGGVLLALDPLLFTAILVVWAGAVAIWRKVGIASSTAAVASGLFGVALLVGGLYDRPHSVAVGSYLVGIAAVVLARHRTNLRDYFTGRRASSSEVRRAK